MGVPCGGSTTKQKDAPFLSDKKIDSLFEPFTKEQLEKELGILESYTWKTLDGRGNS